MTAKAPTPAADAAAAETRAHVTDELFDLRRLARVPEAIAHAAESDRRPTAALRRHAEALRPYLQFSSESSKIMLELHDDAAYLDALVQDLVDLNQLHTSMFPFRREDMDLDQTLERVASFLSTKAQARRVHFEYEPTLGGLHIVGDSSAFVRAVFNFTAHFIFHSAGAGRVRLSAAREGSEVVVRIEDVDLHMAPEQVSRLFDPSDASVLVTMDLRPGRRQNLYLCRKLIEGQGGSVAATTRWPEPGAAIALRFPLASFRDAPV